MDKRSQAKRQRRGQPGNPGQFAPNPSKQAEIAPPHAVNLEAEVSPVQQARREATAHHDKATAAHNKGDYITAAKAWRAAADASDAEADAHRAAGDEAGERGARYRAKSDRKRAIEMGEAAATPPPRKP